MYGLIYRNMDSYEPTSVRRLIHQFQEASFMVECRFYVQFLFWEYERAFPVPVFWCSDLVSRRWLALHVRGSVLWDSTIPSSEDETSFLPFISNRGLDQCPAGIGFQGILNLDLRSLTCDLFSFLRSATFPSPTSSCCMYRTRLDVAEFCMRCIPYGSYRRRPLFSKTALTLNIPRGVLWGPQRVIFYDPAVTISTNLLLIFVCVPHQLKINIM